MSSDCLGEGASNSPLIKRVKPKASYVCEACGAAWSQQFPRVACARRSTNGGGQVRA